LVDEGLENNFSGGVAAAEPKSRRRKPSSVSKAKFDHLAAFNFGSCWPPFVYQNILKKFLERRQEVCQEGEN